MRLAFPSEICLSGLSCPIFSRMTLNASTKRERLRRRTDKHRDAALAKHKRPKAGRTREQIQKEVAKSNDILWWRADDISLPLLPLPSAIVPEKELPPAKLRAIQAVQEFGVWVEASRASGMGRDQLYRLRKADPAFNRELLQARRECFERVEREMIRRALFKGGDLAGIYVLKNNIPRYREISRVELTGKNGGPLSYTDAAKAEILRRLAQLTARQGLEGKEELIIEGSAGSRPQLVAGSPEARIRKAKS